MEKIRSFVDRYGFFILLLTCVAVIAGSGLWAVWQGARDAQDVQTGSTANIEAAEANATRLQRPVPGAVLRGFSEAAYSDTLGLYSAHQAIDLLADAGEAVYAAHPGTVSDIFRDIQLGAVVVISHEHGLETRYAALRWPPIVKKGEAVLAGQPIGTIGVALLETGDPPHLHFSVLDGGKAINPIVYME